MINIIIHGAGGRMGRTVSAMAQQKSDEYRVVAGIDKFPEGAGQTDYPVYSSFADCQEECDCIIDFSLAEALPSVVEAACKKSSALVIATTGLSSADMERIKTASSEIPVFIATNMSLGANLQVDLVKRAAAFFGDAFDIEIVEKHHKKKVDAPSGTALTLAKEIAAVFPDGKDFIYDRHPVRRQRDQREIGLHSVRGGTIIGEHEVMFIGEDEVLEVTHIALSRRVFCVGALRAAGFITGRPPKMYSMSEMLAEEKAVTNANAESDQAIITLLNVPNKPAALAEIFEAVAKNNVNVDMISQSMPVDGNIEISFTLPAASMQKAIEALSEYPFDIKQREGMAKLCIEGAGMEHHPGVAASVFRMLSNAGVEIVDVATSETKISICLYEKDLETAMEAAKSAFEL